jgi:hypothetical protein
MTSFPVFAPVGANATTGAGIKVTANNTPSSVGGSITLPSPIEANALLITNLGTNSAGTGVVIFARVSTEAAPTATAADIPVGLNQSVLVQNPVPTGTLHVAVISSTTTAGDVYFTPVETKLGT